MAAVPSWHRALDALAMWVEDRASREPQGYRPAPPGPLECWGPLPQLPAPPRDGERWSAPAPGGVAGSDDRMLVQSYPAVGAWRGTTIVVPPWKTRSLRILGRHVALARRAGWRVWLLTPPHHLERTRPGARSGEGFVTLDMGALRGVFEQLVAEIRMLVALAAREGPAGVVGLSLGALAAALAATAAEPLEHAVLLAPPSDLMSVLTRTPIGARYRALAVRAGAPLPRDDLLREQLECLDAAARSPNAARIFIATGTEDAIVPPDGPLALARAWRVSPHLYRRGHLSLLFACRALRRDLAAFLAAPATSSSSQAPSRPPPEPANRPPSGGTRRAP